MKVGKRGNALWVRIPVAIVRELNLKAGEEAEIVAVRERSFEVRRVPMRDSSEPQKSR
jgi:antitoxin component of MazEF toxin-antitoxin module